MGNELREAIDRLKENVQFSNQFQNFKAVFDLIHKHSDEFYRDETLTYDLLDVILKILKNIGQKKNQYPNVSRTFLVFLTCINRSKTGKELSEMIKKTNLFLDCISNIPEESLICRIKPITKLSNFFMRNLKNCLSYPSQVVVVKLWLRIFDHIKEENKKIVIEAMRFTSSQKKLNEKMKEALLSIKKDNFEDSCRSFLNQVNLYALKSANIFSLKGKLLGINSVQLPKESEENLWVDFNAGNLSISFSFKLEYSKEEDMKKCFVEILNYNTFESRNVVHEKSFQLLIEPTEYTLSCDMEENDKQLKIRDVVIQLEDQPIKLNLFESKIFYVFKNRAKLERDDASSLVSFAGNESMLSMFTFNNSVSEAPESARRMWKNDKMSVDRAEVSKTNNSPQINEIPDTPMQRENIEDIKTTGDDKPQPTNENVDDPNNNEKNEEEENYRSAVLFPSVELNTDELDAIKKSSDKNYPNVVVPETPQESNIPLNEKNGNGNMRSRIQKVLESDDEPVVLISDDENENIKKQRERENTKKSSRIIQLFSDDSSDSDDPLFKSTKNETVKNMRELRVRSEKQNPVVKSENQKISELKKTEASNNCRYNLRSPLLLEKKRKALKDVFDFNETDDRDEFRPYRSYEKYKLDEPKIQPSTSKPTKKSKPTKSAAPKKSTQTRRQTRNRKTEKISENGNQTFKMKDVKTKSMHKTNYAKFDDSSSDDNEEIVKNIKAKPVEVKPIRRSRRSVTKVAYEIEEYENVAKPPVQKRKRFNDNDFDELKKPETNQLSPRVLRKLNPKRFESSKNTRKEPSIESPNIEPMDFDVDDATNNLDNPKQTKQLRVSPVIAQNIQVKTVDELTADKTMKKPKRKLTFSSSVKTFLEPPEKNSIAIPKEAKQATTAAAVSEEDVHTAHRKSLDRPDTPKTTEKRDISTSPIIFDPPKKNTLGILKEAEQAITAQLAQRKPMNSSDIPKTTEKIIICPSPKISDLPKKTAIAVLKEAKQATTRAAVPVEDVQRAQRKSLDSSDIPKTISKKPPVRRISIEILSNEPRNCNNNGIVYNMNKLEQNFMLKRFVNAISDGGYADSIENLNDDNDNQEIEVHRGNDSDSGDSVNAVENNTRKTSENGESSVSQKAVCEKFKDAIVTNTYTIDQAKQSVNETGDRSSNGTYVINQETVERTAYEPGNLRMCRRGKITIVQEFNELECYSNQVKDNNINDLKEKYIERYQKITKDKLQKLKCVNFKKSNPKKVNDQMKNLINIRKNLRYKTKDYIELLRELQNARQELLYIQTMESSIVNEIFDTNHRNIMELKTNCKDYKEIVDEMNEVGVKALERSKADIWNDYVDQGMNRIRDESRHLYEI